MESNRRNFLQTMAAAGTVALAGRSLFAAPGIGSVLPIEGNQTGEPLPKNKNHLEGHYRPETRFGLGGVAVGNAFAPTSDEDALAAMQNAWDSGTRYFDTSPWYGLGLSERRFGWFLHNQKPTDYVLSTKVGRLLKAAEAPPADLLWKNPSSFDYEYDYSAEGTRRSIEDSLQRMGVSEIDIVFIHDLSPDNPDMKENWTEYFEVARKGAMPELTRMREEGIIKAWGFGVNRPAPALKAVDVADPDIFLLATQYSLMEHEEALNKTFPVLADRGISVVIGAPLNAGFLAGRDRYNYSSNIPEGFNEKRERMMKIAGDHGVDLRTAALQFCEAPKVVSAVIPGARNAGQARANAESMTVSIPDSFWETLKSERLIAQNAPTPTAKT
ncbi:Pyridoxal 4-dehydrogenase [Polystyrenella longa]|uniref:Pyridoxal 4-dehydrogenase n=1 Tax=Polystyrenella longa TaxID=2528007 RepID=A0A518CS51_9PLAN|nr:aldo/keto reductase [Polystyrenella longa]QDU82043.1 Pyridoxal 4-dehydrogenase [Polystyrenella longa]